MIPDNIKKFKIIAAILVLLKYFFWLYFFYLQGESIDLVSGKAGCLSEIIRTISLFIGIKICVMFCDIFYKYIRAREKNRVLRADWKNHFPKKIFNDTRNDQHQINLLFFEYLPEIFDLKISIFSNNMTVVCIFLITMYVLISTHFFSGTLFLMAVFFLNYLGRNIFSAHIDRYRRESIRFKNKIMKWINQYFMSYREISKNWPDIMGSGWENDIYRDYFTSIKNQNFFMLRRDILCQLLVEVPFLLNSAMLMMAVYYGNLSLPQLFIWVGLSQFMITASGAWLENHDNYRKLSFLDVQKNAILNHFGCVNLLPGDGLFKFDSVDLILRDGSQCSLSGKPGLYHIKGKNGSGKTTLMNAILGYERQNYMFGKVNLQKNSLVPDPGCIRVIDREAVMFDCLDYFGSQISGPCNTVDWKKKMESSLLYLLNTDCNDEWMKIFLHLESEFDSGKNRKPSCGEKIIVSCMRFFLSYNHRVRLLIVDECDSFLDREKRHLFLNTITMLSTRMAVFVVSHDDREWDIYS